jgi:hypothetical protein
MMIRSYDCRRLPRKELGYQFLKPKRPGHLITLGEGRVDRILNPLCN